MVTTNKCLRALVIRSSSHFPDFLSIFFPLFSTRDFENPPLSVLLNSSNILRNMHARCRSYNCILQLVGGRRVFACYGMNKYPSTSLVLKHRKRHITIRFRHISLKILWLPTLRQQEIFQTVSNFYISIVATR